MIQYENNAVSTLAADVAIIDGTITVAAGEGDNFPIIAAPI